MKLIKLLSFIIFVMSTIIITGCESRVTSILVFTKANGYVHESTAEGAKAIKYLEKSYPFNVEISEDSLIFNEKSLKNYDVILFLNTSGNILDQQGKDAFVKFIQSGGGFVGIHGASTTDYDWDWYGNLLGTYFLDHPEMQKAMLNVLDNIDISTKHLPNQWEWTDEWYNWRHPLSKNIDILITVDESTYEGGKEGNFHPISWHHEFDGGRSWFTALGHRPESYSDERFMKHIVGGIMWAVSK